MIYRPAHCQVAKLYYCSNGDVGLLRSVVNTIWFALFGAILTVIYDYESEYRFIGFRYSSSM